MSPGERSTAWVSEISPELVKRAVRTVFDAKDQYRQCAIESIRPEMLRLGARAMSRHSRVKAWRMALTAECALCGYLVQKRWATVAINSSVSLAHWYQEYRRARCEADSASERRNSLAAANVWSASATDSGDSAAQYRPLCPRTSGIGP